ncbi:unnamed protein product [Calypogeia fissa]
MNKMQKTKTLSLGRLATLSTIKENLRVKTTFQRNDLPPPSPNVLLSLHPNNLNGGGDTDSPPLLFSAISSYKPEKSPRGASHENDRENSNFPSPGNSPHLDTNGQRAELFTSPKVEARRAEGQGQPPQCEEDSEPEVLHPKVHRLYHSSNGSDTPLESLTEIDREEGHGPEDGDHERLQFSLRGVREEIASSAASPRSAGYGDDFDFDDLGAIEDSEDDEEYWSVPPTVSGLAIDRRELATGDKWIPRHPDMVRVKGYHPFIAEAPLTTLMHFGFLTPTSLHFVHNHGPVPHAAWDNWTVEVTGLNVKSPKKFTMRDLLLFPPRRLPVTLMSSGNRGKELSRAGFSGKEMEGLNWGPGAVSTSVWGGARLRDVLRHCGVGINRSQKKQKGQRNDLNNGQQNSRCGDCCYYVRLMGADRYGTSIPLEVALDESRDVLLAYEQNMELLTPDHGFPVRLIVPGFAEGRSVKWIHKIEISDQDSENEYHALENRMLPSHVEDLQTAITEGWIRRPEFMVNEMNVTSVISWPAHNSNILSASPSNPMKEYAIRGYAYSGAGKKISRVEVSLDGGKSWKLCEVDYQEKPTKFGKYWCWCFWELNMDVEELSRSAEIVARAWDSAMNTQPEVFGWNMLGVMNNCWYRVKIIHDPVIDEDELPTITFEHPTQPGNIPGGWLQEPVWSGHELERTLSIKFKHSESSSSLDVGENSPRTPRPWLI